MKQLKPTTNKTKKFITNFCADNALLKQISTTQNSFRNKKTVIKTAKGRKLSSTLWLQRQLNDIYVKKAKQAGYCSRAAYKLLEINQKFNLIKRGQKIIDLGAAPGGWSQVASSIIGANGLIVAIDLLDLKIKLNNVVTIKGDFLQNTTITQIKSTLQNKANVVLSDLAPNTSGNKELDHLRILNLIENAIAFTKETLLPGGSLVVKVFQGGLEQQLFNSIKSSFKEAKYFKPDASRKSSKEVYLIAKGFSC